MAIIPNVTDLAHFNPINFTEIKAAGIVGVIHKARQGIGYGDPLYARRMAAAKEAGFLWAAYDFATGDDPVANVKEFLKYANLGPRDLAILDFEDNTASEMSGSQAYTFLQEGAQILGRPLALYGGNRVREQIDHQDPKWIDLAKTVLPWQCRYIGSQPVDNEALFKAIPPIPPWTENFGIQYAADGVGPQPHNISGLQNGADLDVFGLGLSLAELANAWGGGSIA